MRHVKWSFALGLVLVAFALLHYTLPQRDIVRIVNTETRRMDFGMNAMFYANGDPGSGTASVNRDIRFIETVTPDGTPSVYRNEDTGWGWPPYFKLDSSNLQARAADLISTRDEPLWVMVTHYGWRSQLLTIFPNAIAIRQVGGPEVRVVPWSNIIVLTVLGLLVIMFWRLWVRFRDRVLRPIFGEEEPGIGRDERRAIWRNWLDRR
ncbi:DUF1523 family protein [Palleronia sp. LCG004]|uniref:DUF1523 family protein n=1 Tax=Palleronia sp. LCG004 TaxID=3079304 RepID=UPI002943A225|nr:DUF1523 family protein [Palleronia sp. LCG004]WOI57411.1 DUF1523 family protein [Palleronia sp. LCG004]